MAVAKNAHELLLGAHMSIAEGLDKAITRGESINCTAIQIFTHSNRQWHVSPLSDEAVHLFKQSMAASSIKACIAHASYLINLASPNSAVRKQSTATLIQELKRCELLEIPYLVLHPGSALDSPKEQALDLVAEALNKAFESSPGSTKILLENMAGQGTVLGATFEELAYIRTHNAHKRRIGFCFDTCHAYAAGYDFTTPAAYANLWDTFDKILGIEHLGAIHLNDSAKEFKTHVDRHADIGLGKIGTEAFRLIVQDKRFVQVPKILETPKTTLQDDARNMTTIQKLSAK